MTALTRRLTGEDEGAGSGTGIDQGVESTDEVEVSMETEGISSEALSWMGGGWAEASRRERKVPLGEMAPMAAPVASKHIDPTQVPVASYMRWTGSGGGGGGWSEWWKDGGYWKLPGAGGTPGYGPKFWIISWAW